MASKFPAIATHSLSATGDPKFELCTIHLDYAEGRRARIEFGVRDRLTFGDTDEAWREELRRVAEALLVASR
jgi:hypothetical protein